MTTAVAAPFRFFSLQVVRTRRLGPSLVRVSFAGSDLEAFASDGRDQSLSLFLPHPGQTEPAVPFERGDHWWQGWRELPEDVRAVMRSYTLRALRRDTRGRTTGIDIDFVLHGVEPGAGAPAGPASRWASRAAAGDRVVLLGPAVEDNRAIRFRPPAGTDLIVLWADETALPAASAILESLPAGTRSGPGWRSSTARTSRTCPWRPTRRSPGSCATAAPPWPPTPYGPPGCRPPSGRTPGSRASPGA